MTYPRYHHIRAKGKPLLLRMPRASALRAVPPCPLPCRGAGPVPPQAEEWEWGWEGAPSGGPERVGCGWLTSPPPRDSRYLVKGPRCLGSPHCQWSAPSARPAALPTLGCQVSDWPKHSTPLLRSRPECVLSPGSASKPPPRPGPPNTRFLGQHREIQTRGSRAAPLPNNPGPPP